MNPPKRRAKRIPGHPGNEDNIVHENEKSFLNLIARIVADIFLKEMEDEITKKNQKHWLETNTEKHLVGTSGRYLNN